MNHDQDEQTQYPHGRGYGHDYMRGGEVLGGYGYSDREEYAKRRGELMERGGRGTHRAAEEAGRG